jgi:hypothetical protein
VIFFPFYTRATPDAKYIIHRNKKHLNGEGKPLYSTIITTSESYRHACSGGDGHRRQKLYTRWQPENQTGISNRTQRREKGATGIHKIPIALSITKAALTEAAFRNLYGRSFGVAIG